MIAVIADDFTGAAELAGIGLRYHLNVELGAQVNKDTKADLFVVATDTRSMGEAEAVQEMEKHTRELMALRPEMIFKKTDSVLRGHVLAEMRAQLSLTGLKKRCWFQPIRHWAERSKMAAIIYTANRCMKAAFHMILILPLPVL
jgi:D-threonate/D-erythronate kinase